MKDSVYEDGGGVACNFNGATFRVQISWTDHSLRSGSSCNAVPDAGLAPAAAVHKAPAERIAEQLAATCHQQAMTTPAGQGSSFEGPPGQGW